MTGRMRPHVSSEEVDLSVAVPIFNEREALPELYRRVQAVVNQLGVSHELILVNDGSSDGSWDVIMSLAYADPAVKAISLSRNFGHQAAITAGLHASAGRAVVFMDGDLQDPPELIPQLYAKFREGFDVVYAQRRTRNGETAWKRTTAALFYRLMRQMTSLTIPIDTGDFRLISRRVADELCTLREHDPFIRGLVAWVGYEQVAVPYDREPRFGGRTKFSTAKMLRFALDGITSFSRHPLRLASHLGLFFAFLSLAVMIALVAYKLLGGEGIIQGWTSLIVAILLLGGLQLIAVGLLGEYVGRIYDQVKGRPLYLVKDRLNLPSAADRTRDEHEPVSGGAAPR